MELTPEEKAVVAQCIADDPSLKRTLSVFWPYILPLFAAAIYGVLEKDYIILSIAFFSLIAEVIWYLNETAKSAGYLKAALIKLEGSNDAS